MKAILFTGASVWDGSGAASYVADVLVADSRVSAISRNLGQLSGADADIIKASGWTLMPGMVEGHAHLSFENVTRGEDLSLAPPEEQTLLTARNAKLLLDCGFTSAYSGAAAKLRLDVVVRDEIEAGHLFGPRIRAATPEITVSGGLGDENLLHFPRQSSALIVDGTTEMRKLVRICVRERCDNIKLNASGDPFTPNTPATSSPMTLEEIKTAVEVAHEFGRKVNVHARSAESIKRSLRAGVDVLYHCEHADEEALDLMEESKDRIFVAPTVALLHTMVHEAAPFGITKEVVAAMQLQPLLEASQRTHTELRKRGIRHLIGGDFGFPWNPQGAQARDLQLFVDYFGYTPAGALQCATVNGGALMMGENQLGRIAEGMLADLLLVDGDPLADLSVLQDRGKILAVVKNGVLYKNLIKGNRYGEAA